ncbi:hypothetical protein KNT98_gp32 [Gordonia phage Frokostdame]|uniref:Uncharacterized protein n=1 Tax=Gordonia phage Frokostdame TaxID=2250320 RepID=A0A345L322_9CAUD|nr:hypothetical protein KNT98_gp32 [Gordonia phage Frokostdame]AXH49674.1 hypothetical protein SEA_FROKOSTDAME_32 [Gordonia phage Frokostdame]
MSTATASLGFLAGGATVATEVHTDYSEITLEVRDSDEFGKTAKLAMSPDEARALIAALTERLDAQP